VLERENKHLTFVYGTFILTQYKKILCFSCILRKIGPVKIFLASTFFLIYFLENRMLQVLLLNVVYYYYTCFTFCDIFICKKEYAVEIQIFLILSRKSFEIILQKALQSRNQ